MATILRLIDIARSPGPLQKHNLPGAMQGKSQTSAAIGRQKQIRFTGLKTVDRSLSLIGLLTTGQQFTTQPLLQKLDRALDHCNAVVMSHTGNPVPLIDRSLLLTLMGRDDAACDDVTKAASLLKQGDGSTDRLLEHELNVRQQSCKQRATMTGNG